MASTTEETPAATPAPETKTKRDVQRQALRELVELSTSCSVEETQIEELHKSEKAQEEKDYERAAWAAEQRAKNVEDGIKQKYAEKQEKIQAQFDGETRSIRSSDQKSKQKIQSEHGPVESGIKKKFDEAVWLADAELDARQQQIRAEQAKAKEDLKNHEDEMASLDDKAADLLKLYGHKHADFDATVEYPATDPGGYAAKRDATQAGLTELQNLRSPRLFVGGRPFVLLFIVLGVALAITQFMDFQKDSQINFERSKMSLIVVGVAVLLASVAIGLLIKFMAKSSVRYLWTRVRHDLDDTRKALKYDYETKLEELGQRSRESKDKRNTEANAAKEKYSPMLSGVQQKRKTAIAQVDEATAAQLKSYEEKRDAALFELEKWRERHEAELKEKVAKELENARIKHAAKLQEIEQRYVSTRAALEKRWKEGLARIGRPMQETGGANGQIVYDWEGTNWSTWLPPRQFTEAVRFGELQVDLKKITDQFPKQLALPKAFSVPANLAFPKQSSLLIHTDREGRPEAIATLQMVMTRLLTSLPAGRVKFTIIDPVGLGQNFAGFMHLADHDESLVGSRIWTEREHIEQRLLNLTEHMETVIQKYLRNEYATIDEYNAQAGELAEPYRFLVIADFPVAFEGDSFRRLSSIASTGSRCGVYTLVIRDTRVPLPQGAHFDELEGHSINLVRKDGKFVWKDEVFKQFPLSLDQPPEEGVLTKIMDVVGKHAKDANRVEVPFEQIAPNDGEMWSQSARGDLHVPIGRMGATRQQSLRLGRGVAQHALVAGKTGSGKSTLLHAIITNIAMWYKPNEVELYLIDFKKGVEFKTYASHELPHARAIAVESDREFGLSVLQRLDAELTRRGEIFRKLGVQDLGSYRDHQTEGMATLPRILLIIDEFQEFFSEDDKLAQDASTLIDRLVRQGRAFGIHVFLGSQTIGGTSGLSRSTIGQMAVRIALQTSEADSQLILGDGNSAARLLSRPGEAIYNDAGGLVEGNSPFQVAYLPDEKRDIFLSKVLERTKKENAWFGERAVVFEGNAPADVKKNARLAALLNNPRPREGAPPATAPVAYLGEPVAIKDPTGISLRRQSGSNILVIGQQDELAMALLQTMMLSLASQQSKMSAKFVLMDGTPADSPLAGVLETMRDLIPQEFKVVEYRAVEEAMAELGEELKRRQEKEDANAPSLYLVMCGLQRFRALRKTEESFSSFGASEAEAKPKPDKIFADLLREGPHLGIHLIAWIDTPVSIERTLERGLLREFDNRVLFQMSANDSSNLVDSPAANKLGMFRALAYSEEQGTMEKFRPYAMLPADFVEYAKSKLQP